MIHHWLTWVLFNVFVLIMLAIDLGVFNRKTHTITIREALIWTGIWIALALLFNVGVYFWMGPDSALDFLTGYLIEKSLSMDNLFVFLLIFSYFNVPSQYQHKVLFWGILGALIMRAIFIFTGVALVNKFEWIIYVFGAFLIYTGIKTGKQKGREIHPEKNPILKIFRRFLPVTNDYHEHHFIIREKGKLWATPLVPVLLVVETTDVIFAVDSIPAIMAITLDPFIIYSSNVFAILGLRALYFALAGIMRLFEYLHYGLSAILIFVGIKMLLSDIYHLPVSVALGVVAGILAVSVGASIYKSRKMPREQPHLQTGNNPHAPEQDETS